MRRLTLSLWLSGRAPVLVAFLHDAVVSMCTAALVLLAEVNLRTVALV